MPDAGQKPSKRELGPVAPRDVNDQGAALAKKHLRRRLRGRGRHPPNEMQWTLR